MAAITYFKPVDVEYRGIDYAPPTYNTNHHTIPFGIYSELTGHFINYMLNLKSIRLVQKNSPKAFTVHDPYPTRKRMISGGGVFVTCGGRVNINHLGEVSITFNEYRNLFYKYLNCYECNKIPQAVRLKLAKELKQIYKDNVNSGVITFTSVVKNEHKLFTFTSEQFELLIAYLAGNSNKVRKYGDELFEQVIGSQNNNPLTTNVAETLSKEIHNLRLQLENDLVQYQQEYSSSYKELRDNYEEQCSKATELCDEKIKQLKLQFESLKNLNI